MIMKRPLRVLGVMLITTVCGGFLATTWHSLSRDPNAVLQRLPSPPEFSRPEQENVDTEEAPPSIDTYVVIQERPVFSRNRRPPESPPASSAMADDVAVGSADFPALLLIGVAMTSAQRVVLFRRLPEGTTLRLVEGDIVDAWKLAKIDARQATFQLGSDVRTVDLATSATVGDPQSLPASSSPNGMAAAVTDN